jgi:nicotinate-nucleotide adenylyltransferase
MSSRIGLYGGTFNPIHFGHLISARSIAEQIALDRVVLIPSASPPHKGHDIAPAEHRLEMARLAVESDPLFEVSDIELTRAGPSYTFDTVTTFRQHVAAETVLFWIIGADSLPELATWSRVRQLVGIVEIVTAARPGWECPDLTALRHAIGDDAVERLLRNRVSTPQIGISATEIRDRIRAGRSIRYFTPCSVCEFIRKRDLYGPAV